MRRGSAPSQLAKQVVEPDKENRSSPLQTAAVLFGAFKRPTTVQHSKRKRTTVKRGGAKEEDEADEVKTKKLGVRRLSATSTVICHDDAAESSHEAFIRSLLKKPFKVPIANYRGTTNRGLGIRRSGGKHPLYDLDDDNLLVLYTPPEYTAEELLRMPADKVFVYVTVDPDLTKVLRPHQREGVKFMYDCLVGTQIEGYNGSIMADEMGLGKTLQCIALAWTLIKQSPKGGGMIKTCVIVTPSSLVKNWANEINKWLKGQLNCLVVDGGTSSSKIDEDLTFFIRQSGYRITMPILIISYESLRLHVKALLNGVIGLIICDEGHRLKNCENQTYQALQSLRCERRVLLSGTPIQNDLLEYFSLLNFVNPGLLGTAGEFRRKYEIAIVKGRDSMASEKQVELGDERLKELNVCVQRCIIRRTQALLTKYLPVKIEQVICCRLTAFQKDLYRKVMRSIAKNMDEAERAAEEVGGTSLAQITNLKKICNHPALVYEKLDTDDAFRGCDVIFDKYGYNHKVVNTILSGKLQVLDMLMAVVKSISDDRFVIVSNYTQTLDFCERLCRLRHYRFVRLDGSMSVKKRGKVVESFNDPMSDDFIFMLSSKAGGCGLNLIGANRLVMIDPDWNPANDDQAMARVWRDGQKKQCFIYRLISTGTIEEKMLQRQAHKKALSSCVVDLEENVAKHYSLTDLRDLFSYNDETKSDTHERLKCTRCFQDYQMKEPAATSDCNSDYSEWHHSHSIKNLNDQALKTVWNQAASPISFVYWQRSHEQIKTV